MISYLFAVLGAVANAWSSVLQRKANAAEPDERSFSFGLVVDLLRSPVWLGGFLAVIAGFVCQAVALSHGALALVEPVFTLELPLTLAFAALLSRRRLHPREWLAVGTMSGGLALLIWCLAPGDAPVGHLGGLGWAAGLLLAGAVVVLLVAQGRRHRGPGRAAWFGVATGVGFGLTAALESEFSHAFSLDPVRIFQTWQTYAMVFTGLSSLFLLQNALQAGPLVAAQPGITLTDPVFSVVWGVFAFGEHIQRGWWLVGAAAGAAAIVVGTVKLSRSAAAVARGAPGGQGSRPDHPPSPGTQHVPDHGNGSVAAPEPGGA